MAIPKRCRPPPPTGRAGGRRGRMWVLLRQCVRVARRCFRLAALLQRRSLWATATAQAQARQWQAVQLQAVHQQVMQARAPSAVAQVRPGHRTAARVLTLRAGRPRPLATEAPACRAQRACHETVPSMEVAPRRARHRLSLVGPTAIPSSTRSSFRQCSQMMWPGRPRGATRPLTAVTALLPKRFRLSSRCRAA